MTFLDPIHSPALMVNDLDLLKKILIGNFTEFSARGAYSDVKKVPESAQLFNLDGSAWKDLRTTLSPIFTTAKLKKILPIAIKKSTELKEILNEEVKMNDVIDVKDLINRYVTDMVVSFILGIEIGYVKNPNSDIGSILNNYLKPGLKTKLKLFTLAFLPRIGKKLKILLISRQICEYLSKILHDVTEYRNLKNIERDDILQFLIDALSDRANSDREKIIDNGSKHTFEKLAAQAGTFLVGSTETSSVSIRFALYELALNEDIQKKARDEIKKVLNKYGGEFTYEALSEMEYLGRVIDESLRKYPPAPNTTRTCASEFQDPDLNFTIEKGMVIVIPIMGTHYNEKYFPNPEKFDPDRFTEENKALRPTLTYMPFGEGPRNCIGLRLAILMMKSTLAILLYNFNFDIVEGLYSIPFEFDPKTVVLSPKEKIMLKISPVNQTRLMEKIG